MHFLCYLYSCVIVHIVNHFFPIFPTCTAPISMLFSCRWMHQWLPLLGPLGAATATGTHQWLEARELLANRLVPHIERAVHSLTQTHTKMK